MSGRPTELEHAGEADAVGGRKVWSTPRVIVSAAAHSEAKGPPTAEISLFFSPTKHTGS